MRQYIKKLNFRDKIHPHKRKLQKTYLKGVRKIREKPLTSVFLVIALIFVLILIGNIIRRVETDEIPQITSKSVETFVIGELPTSQFQAKIEKSGIIKIVALSPGIVETIHVEAGDNARSGERLVSLSSNYQGGNALSVQRQLAASQYTNTKENFEIQKGLLGKQKELAIQTDVSADRLREISENSISSTESLINLNNQITSQLRENIEQLELDNESGENDSSILSARQLLSQLQSGINQLEVNLAQTRFQSGDENAPANLSNLQRDITLTQLELQEKALALSLETSGLQLQLARINEAMMFPSAPFAGVVERVHVREGEYVTPGMSLVTIHGEQTLRAVVSVPRDVARGVSLVEPSTFFIGNSEVSIVPMYVSQEATDGQLYSVQYAIPQEFQDDLTHLGYVTASIPVGFAESSSSIPYIPIDSVYQTQNKTFVFVVEKNTAASREIEVGDVQGSFVSVLSGLEIGDEIILDRTVIDGDEVK